MFCHQKKQKLGKVPIWGHIWDSEGKIWGICHLYFWRQNFRLKREFQRQILEQSPPPLLIWKYPLGLQNSQNRFGLLKGKGTKANNEDDHRGITLFPTLCKIYEMIILNRSEKFVSQAGYFSEMQFGFEEGSGCIEASSTILETINHMLDGVERCLVVFLTSGKLSIRFGLMG